MKTLFAAIALLAAPALPANDATPPSYGLIIFDTYQQPRVAKSYPNLEDLEDCADEAANSGDGIWSVCVPLTPEAEAYSYEIDVCEVAEYLPTDHNVELCDTARNSELP